MASLPWNMREGVTYYISLQENDERLLIKGTFKGKKDDGYYHIRRADGELLLVRPVHVVGASAVRS